MKTPALLILGAMASAKAVTLELRFNEETFSQNTTGTFRLTGAFGTNSFGSSSENSVITSYIFDGSFRGTSTPNLPSDLYLWLQSYSATGTLTRGGITHSVIGEGRALLFAITGGGYTSEPYPWFQISVGPSPEPGPDPFAGGFADISGSFTASKSGGAGLRFQDLAGDYQPHEYDAQGPALTLSVVPEPSTYGLLMAAVTGMAALLRRRRR
ncbi:MAG: PEP-CTERM sorting domain-containing protein [Opitutia bacterium]